MPKSWDSWLRSIVRPPAEAAEIGRDAPVDSDSPIVVSQTGPAIAFDNGVAISGYVENLTIVAREPLARSDYGAVVVMFAPTTLVERDEEIGLLTTFCGDADGPAYSWWRGEAWSGKTALLSWFATHPPAETRVLSFFVTARFAEESNRAGFLDSILLQLAEILNEPVPGYTPASVREAQFHVKLAQAAAACAEAGQRLVLVIDGLDEDLGWTVGGASRSIASLLPPDPPTGVRIIVSSRPHPQLAGDVPDGHPLSQPKTVRELSGSPHAKVLRAEMNGEIRRLLYEGPETVDLLGFLVASRGGLTIADLSALTGTVPGFIEDKLHTTTGRTFLARPSRWLAENAADTYFLGHEELQKTASSFIGDDAMRGYVRRIKEWSDGFEAQNWPARTSQYLFQDYFAVLRATADTDRMFACAVSEARHDRLLDVVGGDSIALAEIIAAQEAVIGQGQPDLVRLTMLAYRESLLRRRNAHVPFALAEYWAAMGDYARAEELARSISDATSRSLAYTAIAAVAARRDDLARVTQFLALEGRTSMAVAKIVPLVAAKHTDWAVEAARGIDNEVWRPAALLETVKAVMAEDSARGAALLRTLTDDPTWPVLLAVVAAGKVAHNPEALETIISLLPEENWLLPFLASAVLRPSILSPRGPDLAVAERVEGLLLDEPDPEIKAVATAVLVEALSTVDPSYARPYRDFLEGALDTIEEPENKAVVLTAIVRLVGKDDPARAAELAATAYELARTVNPFAFGQPLLTDALMTTGSGAFLVSTRPHEVLTWMRMVLAGGWDDFPDADLGAWINECFLLIQLLDPESHAANYLDLAVLVNEHDPQRAVPILHRALHAADRIGNPSVHDRWLLDVAKTALRVDPPFLEEVFEHFHSPVSLVHAMAEAAVASAEFDPGHARETAKESEALARSIYSSHETDEDYAAIARGLGVHDIEKALVIAGKINRPETRVEVYRWMIERTRSLAHLDILKREAVDALSMEEIDWRRAEQLTELATVLHAAGDPQAVSLGEQAVALALQIGDDRQLVRAKTLLKIARTGSALDQRTKRKLIDEVTGLLPSFRANQRREIERAMACAPPDQGVDTSRSRDEAYAAAAKTAARHGTADAVEMANRIEDLEHRTRVHALIGRWLPTWQADQLVVQALTTGNWKEIMPLISAMEPGAVVAVADEILDGVVSWSEADDAAPAASDPRPTRQSLRRRRTRHPSQ